MQNSIEEIMRPEDVLLDSTARTPALAALRQLRERWSGLALTWGPTGGVGFELATGECVTTETSDLDIVIRVKIPIAKEDALILYDRAAGLGVRTDIRVETPACGFSLEEFTQSSSGRILLRYPGGATLGSDPWRAISMGETWP